MPVPAEAKNDQRAAILLAMTMFASEQQQVAKSLIHDAEVMSNTQLAELPVGRPKDVQAEIVRINTDAHTSRAFRIASRTPASSPTEPKG